MTTDHKIQGTSLRPHSMAPPRADRIRAQRGQMRRSALGDAWFQPSDFAAVGGWARWVAAAELERAAQRDQAAGGLEVAGAEGLASTRRRRDRRQTRKRRSA